MAHCWLTQGQGSFGLPWQSHKHPTPVAVGEPRKGRRCFFPDLSPPLTVKDPGEFNFNEQHKRWQQFLKTYSNQRLRAKLVVNKTCIFFQRNDSTTRKTLVRSVKTVPCWFAWLWVLHLWRLPGFASSEPVYKDRRRYLHAYRTSDTQAGSPRCENYK